MSPSDEVAIDQTTPITPQTLAALRVKIKALSLEPSQAEVLAANIHDCQFRSLNGPARRTAIVNAYAVGRSGEWDPPCGLTTPATNAGVDDDPSWVYADDGLFPMEMGTS